MTTTDPSPPPSGPEMIYGRGFCADELVLPTTLFPDQTHETVLGAAPLVFPDSIVNSDLVDEAGGVRDQKTTSGCVGFTFAEVLSILFAGLGIRKIFSAYFFYWLGRAVGLKAQGLPNTTALLDAGTMPSYVVQGALNAGGCLEEVMPSDDPSVVNVPEKSAAASDASARIPLFINAFVAILAANDNDTETAVLQGLLARANGTRGRLVMGAICADPLQGNDGSVVVEPKIGGKIDHMVSILDAVKILAYDPASRQGLLANGLTLTFAVAVAPIVGQRVYRWLNHWSKNAHAQCDIPGTFWSSRAFMLSAVFKYIIQIDEEAARKAA